jgi:hypothetical protein
MGTPAPQSIRKDVSLAETPAAAYHLPWTGLFQFWLSEERLSLACPGLVPIHHRQGAPSLQPEATPPPLPHKCFL